MNCLICEHDIDITQVGYRVFCPVCGSEYCWDRRIPGHFAFQPSETQLQAIRDDLRRNTPLRQEYEERTKAAEPAEPAFVVGHGTPAEKISTAETLQRITALEEKVEHLLRVAWRTSPAIYTSVGMVGRPE